MPSTRRPGPDSLPGESAGLGPGSTRRRFLTAFGVTGLAAIAVLPVNIGSGSRWSRSDSRWRARLTPDQHAVLRQNGTEPPFSSALLHESRIGLYSCAGCRQELFASPKKFDSGTGWPSFWAPIDNAVTTTVDHSGGLVRTAVSCRRCEGHLGHVFTDGPPPTGLRYCINGCALTFTPIPIG